MSTGPSVWVGEAGPCPDMGWVFTPPWSLSQPERINPELNQKGYNVKSDVWSLGITMVCGWGTLAGRGSGWGLSCNLPLGKNVGFPI